MTKEPKYIVSKVTTYFPEHLLWETKVGIDNKNMDLLYSCWGQTADLSRKRAEQLVLIVTLRNQS